MRKFTMSTIQTMSNVYFVYCERHVHYIHYVYDVSTIIGNWGHHIHSGYSGHDIKSPKGILKLTCFVTPLGNPTPIVPSVSGGLGYGGSGFIPQPLKFMQLCLGQPCDVTAG